MQKKYMYLDMITRPFFQLEELYVEILYTILHMIGCDAEREEQKDLIEHLQDAFHMSDDKHATLLDIASMREVKQLENSELGIQRDDIVSGAIFESQLGDQGGKRSAWKRHVRKQRSLLHLLPHHQPFVSLQHQLQGQDLESRMERGLCAVRSALKT